ncbi:MAG: NUDIX hydrolase [Rikenellaceae bacterium]|nr:NUDIX hydrolase [Rikenellaceae bacterium]
MVKRPAHRPWKVLSSEYLSHEPWYTVRRERVELPSGAVVPNWYIFEFPDWVNVIARTAEGSYVMISQYRHALGETHYELVAGCCDDGENPLEAAQRELMEETGYGGGQWRLLMVTSPNPTNHTNHSYTFVAEGVVRQQEQHAEESEDIDIHLMQEEELRTLLVDDRIVQALHAAPLWKYFATK